MSGGGGGAVCTSANCQGEHFAQGDTTLLHRQGEQEWTLIMVSHSFCMWLLTAGIPVQNIYIEGMPAVSNHIQKLCDTIIN